MLSAALGSTDMCACSMLTFLCSWGLSNTSKPATPCSGMHATTGLTRHAVCCLYSVAVPKMVWYAWPPLTARSWVCSRPKSKSYQSSFNLNKHFLDGYMSSFNFLTVREVCEAPDKTLSEASYTLCTVSKLKPITEGSSRKHLWRLEAWLAEG
jgi:hypothetical protein